jgi:hypothetical protein
MNRGSVFFWLVVLMMNHEYAINNKYNDLFEVGSM